MNLLLQRTEYLPNGTPGQLSVNGEVFCATLERAKDDPQHPCIPAGLYKVLLFFSPKFNRIMPHIMDVPGRTAIEIHWGNMTADTDGCVLVGNSVSNGLAGLWLDQSRNTFDELYKQLETAQIAGIDVRVLDALD